MDDIKSERALLKKEIVRMKTASNSLHIMSSDYGWVRERGFEGGNWSQLPQN